MSRAPQDPALVFSKDIEGPATHVLAIGIGAYPYLVGGSKRQAAYTMELGQLTSPPASALAIAEWFASHYVCPDRPLASIGLLMSCADSAPLTWNHDGHSKAVPNGSLARVKAAVRAWLGRAHHAESRIILYFCGHGFAKGAQNFYLLRDFGADNQQPMANAINYTEFVTALESRRAQNQLLIFDACRQSNDLVEANITGGDSIIDVLPDEREALSDIVKQCAIFATTRDRAAKGFRGKPSLCAEALIRAFKGAAYAVEDGAHYVTTPRLIEALRAFQNYGPLAARLTVKPDPDVGRFAILRMRRFVAPPEIPVFIRRHDGAKLEAARIQATRRGQTVQLTDNFTGTEFETALPAGDYSIETWLKAKACQRTDAVVEPVTTIVPVTP